MAPVGIAERVCIVLENVDFSGQTFFPQSLFSRRQAGFKQSLTGFIVNDEVENIIALGGGILRMAASVLIEPSAVHQERVGRPAVWNETFKNIPQHLLHRQIDTSVRRKNEAVLILQTKDPSSQGIGFQHANTTRIPAGSAFFNSRTRSADAVCLVRLVCFVYLVDLVYLVSFVQPNKRDRPNKPNNSLLTLAGFFSILLGCEELFGVDRREAAEFSSVAGAIQDCHFQALQRELLVPNLVECGHTEGESNLKLRKLRKPFLL